MKTKDEMDSTTNSRVYKRLRARYLSLSKGMIRCSYCPPNKGCNSNRRKKRDAKRNWKKYRKNQWKEDAI